MRVDGVLAEYGYILKSMITAPRDGRAIVVYSRLAGAKIYQWEAQPPRFAGPAWFGRPDDHIGYVDRYFLGWIDLQALRPIDEIGLQRLLIAYIDEMP